MLYESLCNYFLHNIIHFRVNSDHYILIQNQICVRLWVYLLFCILRFKRLHVHDVSYRVRVYHASLSQKWVNLTYMYMLQLQFILCKNVGLSIFSFFYIIYFFFFAFWDLDRLYDNLYQTNYLFYWWKPVPHQCTHNVDKGS